MTRGASHTMVHQAERSPAEIVRAASFVWTAAALPGKQSDSSQGALFTYVVVRCLSVDSLPDMRPNTIVPQRGVSWAQRPDVTAKGNPAECGVRRPEAIHHAAGEPSTDVTGRFVSSGCSAGRDVNYGKRLARPCQGPLVLPCPAPQRTGSGAPPPGSHLEAPVEPTSPDGCGEGRIRLLGRCGRGNITTESCVMTILPCRVRTQRGFPTPTAHDSSRRRCSDPRR